MHPLVISTSRSSVRDSAASPPRTSAASMILEQAYDAATRQGKEYPRHVMRSGWHEP